MSRAPEAPLRSDDFERLLRERAAAFKFAGSEGTFGLLARYLEELDRWRRKVNLTGDLSPEDLAEHTLESVLGSPLLPRGARVADVGSGGGFPAIPLAIARPDAVFTLIEPRAKRAAFLRHLVRTLGLQASVVEKRFEEVGGQTFDCLTTRAVGNVGSWLSDASLLSPGGSLIAWTSDPEGLAQELPMLRLERALEIPGAVRRQIAVLRKLP